MSLSKLRHNYTRAVSLFFVAILFAGLVLGLEPLTLAKAATFTIADGDVYGPNGLIAAINAANSNGQTNTINLAPNGSYSLTSINNTGAGGDGNGLPQISSNLTIEGNGANIQRSSTNGTANFRIFYVIASGSLRLHGLMISNGNALVGGGVANLGGALIVDGCNFSQNVASPFSNNGGGAIYNGNQGTLIIKNSLFSNNSANGNSTAGGAIMNMSSTVVTITNSTFLNNSATGGGGGAIYNTSQNPMTITNSTFTSNTGSGGGAIINSGTLTINNSTFNGNTGTASGNTGGGAIINFGNMNVTNSTFSNNSTADKGGAIISSIFNQTIVYVTNSTFSGNSSLNGGDSIATANNSPITLRNNLFVSSGASCAGTVVPVGTNNLEYTGTAGSASCGTGSTFTATKPLSNAGLTNNGGTTQTIALTSSPNAAIDGGDSQYCPATDQRYFSRVGVCDIGAYEYNGITLLTPALNKSFNPTNINIGEVSAVQFTLNNSSNTTPLTNVSFDDTLPAQMKIAASPGILNGCGSNNGTVNAVANGNSISVSGVTLAASQNCTISVNITSNTGGSWINTTSASYSDETGPGMPAPSHSATLTVCDPLQVKTNLDNGSSCGTLRYAVNYLNANPGNVNKIINIGLTSLPATITLSGSSLNIPAGVAIQGICNAATKKPDITIDGNGIAGPGFTLNGGDILTGLKIKGFTNTQIHALKGGNTLKCIEVSRS